MSELINALRQFLLRDIIFILGGSSVILSVFYSFHPSGIPDIPTPYYFLAAGVAYGVGYAVQDLSCILGLVTTAHYFEPCKLVKWLYYRYERSKWQQPTRFDPHTIWIMIEQCASEETKGRLERIVVLKMMGTTMGPCAIFSAVLLFVRWYRGKYPEAATFDLTLAIFAFVLGLGLVCLAWLKAAQQVYFMAREENAKG